MKSVKEVSQLSGVSVRTLHYYDEIDLLKPSVVAENGYRYYNRFSSFIDKVGGAGTATFLAEAIRIYCQ